jgi:hypothetical protein
VAEPDTAADYGDREVNAAFSVLIELGQVLGAYRGKFVVIGGAVPWLLLPDAEPAHIGTLDIDLNLDPAALGDGEYADFVETLENAGYQRGLEGMKKFQLRRTVKVDDGDPVAVIGWPGGSEGRRGSHSAAMQRRASPQGQDAGWPEQLGGGTGRDNPGFACHERVCADGARQEEGRVRYLLLGPKLSRRA